MVPKPAKTLDLQRKWKLALLASVIFHAAVALFFMLTTDEAVLMEGAEFSGIAFLGEGADQVKAGDIEETEEPAVDVTMVTMLEARPVETVEAETVPVEETVEATELAETVTTEVETLEPVKETPAEPVNEPKAELVQAAPNGRNCEPVESKPAPAVSETVPEVLATDRVELVEDDNVVQKPAETQLPSRLKPPRPHSLSRARFRRRSLSTPPRQLKSPKPSRRKRSRSNPSKP